MIQVHQAGIDILIQVYDELVIEEPEEGIQEAVQKTINLLENCMSLSIPLVVDSGIGSNWSECK